MRLDCEPDDYAFDIFLHLAEVRGPVAAAATCLQAGVRGLFVRRCLLSEQQLELEIAERFAVVPERFPGDPASRCPVFSPDLRPAPSGLCLRPIASRLS